MNKTLLLCREFTVKNFTRALELISQYNIIYKDSDLRLTISNEFIDDTTLYLSIFKLHEKLDSILGNIENKLYLLTINVYKPMSKNTLEKILELTQVNNKIKVLFNIKINDSLNLLSIFDTLNKYSRLLPNGSFFSMTEFYFNNQDDEFINELFDKLSSYNRKEISIIPTFRKDIISDEYVSKAIDLVERIYSDSIVTSPDIILNALFNKIYGCNVQWDEIPIIFKDDDIYSTYCSNVCCNSTNIDFLDIEHKQRRISNIDDLKNVMYAALKANDKLPGYISCPLQNTSSDYMSINAFMSKVKEILYNRYKN